MPLSRPSRRSTPARLIAALVAFALTTIGLVVVGPAGPAGAATAATGPTFTCIKNGLAVQQSVPCDYTSGPPSLLSSVALDTPGPYHATPDQQAALAILEQQAEADMLIDHHLPASQTATAQTWGRDDSEAELWALIVRAITTPPAQRTDTQQSAVDWMTEVVHWHSEAAASRAGLEYVKWAGLGQSTYEALLRTQPSQAELTAFLQQPPIPYDNIGSATNPWTSTGGFCAYRSPAPFQGEYSANVFHANQAPQLCFTPCPPYAGCEPVTPTTDQFLRWGAGAVDGDTLTSRSFLVAASDIATEATWGTVAAGAGVGAGLSLGLPATIAADSSFVTSLFPFTMRVAAVTQQAANNAKAVDPAETNPAQGEGRPTVPDTKVELNEAATEDVGSVEAESADVAVGSDAGQAAVADTSEVVAEASEASAEAGAEAVAEGAGVVAGSIGFAVTIAIIAIAIAIQQGIHVVTNAKIPAQLAGAVVSARTTTPDLAAILHDPDLTRALFALFVGATLPSPRLTHCDNSQVLVGSSAPAPCLNAPDLPAPAGTDPVFRVQAQGSATASTSGTLSWKESQLPLTKVARISGTWFVQTTTASHGGATATVQTLRMHYSGWDGTDRNAWLSVDPQGNYSFLIVADVGADSTPGDPADCLASSVCAISSTIQYIGADGRQMTASIVPPPAPSGPAPAVSIASAGNPGCRACTPSISAIDHPSLLRGSFTPAVAGDSGTLTVDWGDGTTSQEGYGPHIAGGTLALVPSGGRVAFTGQHTYQQTKIFTATVSVREGTAVATVQVDRTVDLDDVLAPQVIRGLGPIPSHTYGDAPIRMSVTGGGSQLPVDLFASGVVPGTTRPVCDLGGFVSSTDPNTLSPVTGALLRLLGPGTCTVTALQPGAVGWAKAGPVTQSFTVAPAPLTVTALDTIMAYGDTAPALRTSFAGFVNGQGAGVLTGLHCSAVDDSDQPVGRQSPLGTYPITCTGATADNYTISYQPGHLSVVPTPTHVDVSASSTTPTVGSSVTYRAVVSSTTGVTPGGTVTFTADGTPLCSGVTLAAGSPASASCTTTVTTAGTEQVVAHYGGDSSTEPSTSAPLPVTAGGPPTPVSVTVDASRPRVGQEVTFTATVLGILANPTGTVTFSTGGQSICDNARLSDTGPYQATCTTTFPSVGSRVVTAHYNGDSQTPAATSAGVGLVVTSDETVTSVTASTSTPTVGQAVTYTATVTTQPGVDPFGQVTFSDGTTDLCSWVQVTTFPPDDVTQATCTQTYSTPGVHHVVARYNGDPAALPSTSSALVVVAERAPSSTTVVSVPATPMFGQQVSLQATVAAAGSGASGPTPDGKVTFLVDGVQLGDPVTLAGGVATSGSTDSLAPGPHQIAASYSGDATYTESSGDAATSVGCAQHLSGTVRRLTVTKSACLEPGATVTGTITVGKGAALSLDGVTVTAPIMATQASAIRICGSRISGPLRISGTNHQVQIGGTGCAGNVNSGSLSVAGTRGLLTVMASKLSGPMLLTQNTGGVLVLDDVLSGSSRLTSNSNTPMTVAGSTTTLGLDCIGNAPAPVNGGLVDTLRGQVTGQCSQLGQMPVNPYRPSTPHPPTRTGTSPLPPVPPGH